MNEIASLIPHPHPQPSARTTTKLLAAPEAADKQLSLIWPLPLVQLFHFSDFAVPVLFVFMDFEEKKKALWLF